MTPKTGKSSAGMRNSNIEHHINEIYAQKLEKILNYHLQPLDT